MSGTPKYIDLYGNQLVIVMDDGVKFTAVPTNVHRWLVSGIPGTGGGTGPPTTGTGTFSWPFDPSHTVSSEYGPRSGGVGTFHEGIDFGLGGVHTGSDIFCAGAGTLEQNYYHTNFGNLAIVFHGTMNGFDWRTLYAHMLNPCPVSVGSHVTRGQPLGEVDTTGAAFGPHLHWETHKCPIGGGIVWNTYDPSAYRTAINPRSFMSAYGDGGVLNTSP